MGKRQKREMKNSLCEIEKIYEPGKSGVKLDWMGFEIDENNFPTYHHIIKQSTLKENQQRDEFSIENCAYLGDLSHSVLHMIENVDKNLYNRWNDLFRLINDSKTYPSLELLEIQKELSHLSEIVCDKIAEENENTKKHK